MRMSDSFGCAILHDDLQNVLVGRRSVQPASPHRTLSLLPVRRPIERASHTRGHGGTQEGIASLALCTVALR